MKKLIIYLDENKALYDEILSSLYAVLDEYGFVQQEKIKYTLQDINKEDK